MTKHAHRILFVFAPHLDEEHRLQADIRHYQIMMRRTTTLGGSSPEYFILVVTPHISATAQCTPEIQAYVRRNTEECLKQLARIGTALGIPPERQCLAEGNRNLEARRVATLFMIDDVYGYSKGFVKLLTLWKTGKSTWKHLMKQLSSSWFLRRKSRTPRAIKQAATTLPVNHHYHV